MKAVKNSLMIAFSMYSKIPMSRAEWNEENMKYVICFFPLVGAVIGAMIVMWQYLGSLFALSQVLQTVIIIMIPLLITGGIHMDGFLDTTDARSSYQTPERKLEILKDPHAGAFAIIACGGYYMLSFGIWYDRGFIDVLVLAVGFVFSRALSGLAIVTFPLAKNSGLAATFSNQAKKKVTRIAMLIYLVVCMTAMLMIHLWLGIFCIAGAGVVFVYCYYMARREFGGITGDVAGYFLQVCELTMAFCVILGGKICG